MKAIVYIDGRRMGGFDYEHPIVEGKTITIPTASEEYDSEATIAVHDDGNAWFGTTTLRRDGVGTSRRDAATRFALRVAASVVGPLPIDAMTHAPTVAQMQALQAALRKAGVL